MVVLPTSSPGTIVRLGAALSVNPTADAGAVTEGLVFEPTAPGPATLPLNSTLLSILPYLSPFRNLSLYRGGYGMSYSVLQYGHRAC